MRHALLPLTVLALLAVAPRTAAQEAPAEKLLLERSYYLYFSGSRIGWQKSWRYEASHDGKPAIREKDQLYARISRDFDGLVIEIKSDGETLETPQGRPIRKHEVSVNGPQTTTRTATFGTDSVTVTETIDAGQPRIYSIDTKGRNVAGSNWAWQELKRNDRLKKGETISYDKLSLENHSLEKDTWTV
ncbi:MAG: hypothetical protein KJ044_16450, partial [Planctomycetes bacterium]|nr:hypothetical protein [Planctomycetota bacterium]